MLSLQWSLTKKSSRQNIPSLIKMLQPWLSSRSSWSAMPRSESHTTGGFRGSEQSFYTFAQQSSHASWFRLAKDGRCVGVNALINGRRSCFPSISPSVKVCKLPELTLVKVEKRILTRLLIVPRCILRHGLVKTFMSVNSNRDSRVNLDCGHHSWYPEGEMQRLIL